MPYQRSRPRIAIGFAPGGRSSLIDSLTPSANELQQKKLLLQEQDRAKVNAFNRGDISFEELESYLQGRIGTETDAVWKSQLTDSLATAKFKNQGTKDDAKVAAWRSGAISFADLEKYFGTRIAAPLNGNDGQLLSDRLASLRAEYNNKTDQSNLTKWKAGQMSNADFKAYLQGRLAGARTDEDKANLGAAIKGVDVKQRQDDDKAAAAKYKADGDIKAYTNYLTTQAARKDITPEEQASYESARESALTAYNQAQDNKVYYEYLKGDRTAESAQKYYQDRMSTAKPLEQDNIQQRMAQVQEREDAKLKAMQTASARGSAQAQSQLDALVQHKVDFAKKMLDEKVKESALIADPKQRAQAILDAYNAYGNVLEAASQTTSTKAGEYLALLGAGRGNLSKQAQVDIQEHVGNKVAESAISMNNATLGAAGKSATDDAASLAEAVARAREALGSPFLSPDKRDALAQHLKSLEEKLRGRLSDQVGTRDAAVEDLGRKVAEAEATAGIKPDPGASLSDRIAAVNKSGKVTPSFQAEIDRLQTKANQAEQGRQALFGNLSQFAYQPSHGGEGFNPYGSFGAQQAAEQDARENQQHAIAERGASQPPSPDAPSWLAPSARPAGPTGASPVADPFSGPSTAGRMTAPLSNVISAFNQQPGTLSPVDFASSMQRASTFVPPDSADQQREADNLYIDPNGYQPGKGGDGYDPYASLKNIDLSGLDWTGPGSAFGSQADQFKQDSQDEFGRFNRAITDL